MRKTGKLSGMHGKCKEMHQYNFVTSLVRGTITFIGLYTRHIIRDVIDMARIDASQKFFESTMH